MTLISTQALPNYFIVRNAHTIGVSEMVSSRIGSAWVLGHVVQFSSRFAPQLRTNASSRSWRCKSNKESGTPRGYFKQKVQTQTPIEIHWLLMPINAASPISSVSPCIPSLVEVTELNTQAGSSGSLENTKRGLARGVISNPGTYQALRDSRAQTH